MLKRNVIMNLGFIELSKNESLDGLNKNKEIITNFMKTFKPETSKIPYSLGVVGTSDILSMAEGNFTQKPLQILPEKNVIKYRIDFNDTKLVGKSITSLTEQDKK